MAPYDGTYDLRIITNALLYQLSYTGGLMFRVVKKPDKSIEPTRFYELAHDVKRHIRGQ